MSDQILLATKKGTLIIDRKNGRWTPRPIAHAGLAVSYAARDPRDGTLWACMDNAHWGPPRGARYPGRVRPESARE